MPGPSRKAHQAATIRDLRTIRDLLRYATSRFTAAGLVFGHGTTNARDEAAFLILETLSLPIDTLDPWLDARLTVAERRLVVARIEDRVRTRKPAAYITGRTYIQGLPIRVDPRVIVPRSYLAELLTGDLFGGEGFTLIADPSAVASVLDLCTGSGCLAIIAARIFPNAEVHAVDLSKQALAVAKANIWELELTDRIVLHHGDLFAPLGERRFDLIVTNPPYVDRAAMAALPPEYRHEPRMALDGGVDGLDFVRRIVADAGKHLKQGGGLLCEIGTGRQRLEAEFPALDLLWLDTAESEGEVFWATAEALQKRMR